ncbi:ATP-binding cassette domain-containing protein, partial [Acinetobacter baumannii]
MEHSVVDIKGLRKSFGSHLVLKDIDFSVSPSQVVVIIGPSGSGKSTLLRCLNGLETAEGGTVVVGGHTVVEGGRMMPEAMLDA